MKVSTENDIKFGYEKITIVVDNIPLKSFIKTNKLIDAWRIYNENKQQFTWRRKDKTQASWIDMILLGNNF
jgi:hypothetical protein